MIETYNADCMDVLPRIKTGSVDMVLADLPYGTTKCAWDSIIPLEPLWAEYKRVAKGPVLLFAQTPFAEVLGCSNIDELKYEWVWEKSHASNHLNAKKQPLRAHEKILVFYKNSVRYFPVKTDGHQRKTATKRSDTTPLYGAQKFDALRYDSTQRFPRSVLKFASDKQRLALHPTQKPLALCEYLIRTYTREGDTVLDNVMGSGTTGVAALNMKRKFIGIEKDLSMYLKALRRLEGNV